MHRRLPIYLLIDTSYSMMGEPIEAVQNGLDSLVSALHRDPQALETAYLSIIEFNNDAKQLEPLKELSEFQTPILQVNGMTSMGAALSLLVDCIQKEVLASNRRDWRPMVFLFTDGMANDNLQQGIDKLKTIKTGTFVACAAGPSADTKELLKITEAVVKLDETDSASIAAFFKWVSSSISVSSQKVEQGNESNGLDDLPPPPPEINIIDLSKK
ncbi:MAG: tellerium resistance protein TerY [Sulfurovum sp. FS08-3]|nr:MAG: tellerium resistance protein TerY [Sulfurovum sp. FS08-3]